MKKSCMIVIASACFAMSVGMAANKKKAAKKAAQAVKSAAVVSRSYLFLNPTNYTVSVQYRDVRIFKSIVLRAKRAMSEPASLNVSDTFYLRAVERYPAVSTDGEMRASIQVNPNGSVTCAKEGFPASRVDMSPVENEDVCVFVLSVEPGQGVSVRATTLDDAKAQYPQVKWE